jgi:LysM repeat protein
MQRAGGVFMGLVTALVSSGLVLGSIVLSLTEGGVRLALAPPSTSISFNAEPFLASPTSSLPEETLEPGQPTYTSSPIPSPAETETPTLPPPPTDCPPPDGWVPITIAPGDTLRILAGRYGTTQEALAEANCLITSRLIPGSILYVPGPAPTPPPISCGPPSGWIFYTVQPGDTLYRLSLTFRVSVSQLQLANCMGNATGLRAGQRIYTPYLPPPPPSPTPSPTPATPSEPVPSLEPPTVEPVPTSPPPPTATATQPPAPTLAPSETPVPTGTPVIEETPTNSPPEISPISSQTTDEDVPADPVIFTVSDLETPAGELMVSASSSNPALVPVANIVLGGSGAARTLTITPAADQSGTATITVTVKDSSGDQASASFDLVVVPVNDAPVARDDFASTIQDTQVAIPVLANDSDVDGDLLQIGTFSEPANGSVHVAGETLVYTPNSGYTGEDSFTYTVSDGVLESLPATVTVTITSQD